MAPPRPHSLCWAAVRRHTAKQMHLMRQLPGHSPPLCARPLRGGAFSCGRLGSSAGARPPGRAARCGRAAASGRLALPDAAVQAAMPEHDSVCKEQM